MTTCVIFPRYEPDSTIEVNAWVIPKITINVPNVPLPSLIKNRLSHLALADPTFDIPAPIDLLLGADLYHHVINEKKYSESEVLPTAYSSIFGWILIGPVNSCQVVSHQSFIVSLEDMLLKFWETEEPVNAPIEVTEDGLCEKLFFENSYRNKSGRFVVPLPFKDLNPETALKGSKSMATKRFLNLERKLLTNPMLYNEYRKFMDEYQNWDIC